MLCYCSQLGPLTVIELEVFELFAFWSNVAVDILTLKAPFMTKVAFVANVDQDQAAQNVQPDL